MKWKLFPVQWVNKRLIDENLNFLFDVVNNLKRLPYHIMYATKIWTTSIFHWRIFLLVEIDTMRLFKLSLIKIEIFRARCNQRYCGSIDMFLALMKYILKFSEFS